MGLFDKPPIKEVFENFLAHEGVGHDKRMSDGRPGESGRYPYGSGENPYQHQPHALLDFDKKMEALGYSQKERADLWSKKKFGENYADKRGQGYTVTQYRDALSLAKTRIRQDEYDRLSYLYYQEHKGPSEIARLCGYPNESTVRSKLKEASRYRMNKADETANILRDRMNELGGDKYLDIGAGVEHELGLTRTSLNKSLMVLRQEGYVTYSRRVDQVTNPNGKKTTITLLCPPGTNYKDVYAKDSLSKINSVIDYTSNKEFKPKRIAFQYPESLNSKRLYIRYAEEGGTNKDGLIEIRPGVEDLSLGEDRYAQVRIAVDGTHYLKGMAVYSENIPDGYDVVFNTNKSSQYGMFKTLKPLKTTKDENGKEVIDRTNPFGSVIKAGEDATTLGEGGGQSYYIDKNGKQKLSLINKTSSEGDWNNWKDQIPSQFLAKQPMKLINQQLNLTLKDKRAQYNEILSVSNPTIRREMLKNFADECDSAAVDLKAMALPGQKWHVIIPLDSMPDNEVYAPQYKNGETVALIRYPHGGTFEIPILTVNNKRKEGQKVITTKSSDAVGINTNVAQQLSGADFDGDTVMLVPCNSSTSKIKIHAEPRLKELEGFEPKILYGPDMDNGERKDENGVTHYYRNGKEYKVLKDGAPKEREMGVISNLIMDMTLQDATDDEKARAVRHSMVIIDAPKHKLDYKQSEIDNNIIELKKKYQIKYIDEDGNVKYGGASTLITRAKSEDTKAKTQGQYHIDEYWDNTANNGKGAWVSTGKNEGKKYYRPTEDLYYPKGSYNKETGVRTLITTDGKKISYNVKDTAAYNKYHAVEKKDPKTGKVTYTNPSGSIEYQTEYKKQKTTKMENTEDAMTLLSTARTQQEIAYGNYANSLKALANEARKEYMNTPNNYYSASARKIYKEEYDTLIGKLRMSQKNSPKEHMAQIIANQEVNAKIEQAQLEGEKLSSKEKSKIAQMALTEARLQVGASRNPVNISPKEWEAIQAGAIGSSTLSEIFKKAEEGQIRDYAIPKSEKGLTAGQIARIKNLYNSDTNYTIQQISSMVGVSPSTVEEYVKKS